MREAKGGKISPGYPSRIQKIKRNLTISMEKKYDPAWEGDFNREDSDTEKRPRKSKNQEEETVSSPFSRDKRPRIRRVTEQLNERTPRPRITSEGDDRKRESPEIDDRRSYERPAPDNRRYGENREQNRHASDAEGDNRRRSYNPNFDDDNRLRRPAPRRDRYESSEEDNRFNSYHYDRDSQPRDNRSRYQDDRPQQRDNRPRYNEDRAQRDSRPQYNNDDRAQRDSRPHYNNDDRPQRDNRYNNNNRDRDDRYGNNRENRYGNRDYSRDNNRENSRDNGRGYQQRDDRDGRTGNTRKPYQQNNNRPGFKKPTDPFRTPKGGYDSEYKPKIYPAYSAANIVEPIRLNKFISMSGLCSRREADEFIKEGQITVNGEVVTEMGVKINPTDVVSFNGEILQGEKRVYILMNKPKGFVTTVEDPNADRTVMDIVKNACKERVYPVGRLDKNSLGVLLITNDGELTKKLTHPGHEKKKIYQVTIDRPATKEELSKLLDGVELEDGIAMADEVELLYEGNREIGITIHTGRNRIVRRMFEALGYHVQKLDRVYFAGLTKKSLRRGAWRYLTPKEVAMLKAGSYQ